MAHRLLPRAAKEALLSQHGVVVWMTGFSGSGKSTIAIGLEQLLHQAGHYSVVLDGDNIRTGINGNLGFSDADRTAAIHGLALLARAALDQRVDYAPPARVKEEG